MNIEEIPNALYDLVYLILNSGTVITTPLAIPIRPSNSNEASLTTPYIVINYAPNEIKFEGLNDIMIERYDTTDDLVHQDRSIPCNGTAEIREVNGKGNYLQFINQYKEHPVVRDYLKSIDMSFRSVDSVKTIPFKIEESYHYESIMTIQFGFTTSYSNAIDYFANATMGYDYSGGSTIMSGSIDVSLEGSE